ncbi:MAG: hypothetical protein PHY47_01740 [Lachnospiraceae bacterium]|nr:hypothetical protein [Lachnospiraceae bacterium]
MTENIFFHIGTPKTGSSALQFFLLENKEKLEKQGFLYPGLGISKRKEVNYKTRFSGNGTFVRNCLLKDQKHFTIQGKKLFQKIISLSDSSNIIISEETLFNDSNYDFYNNFIQKGRTVKVIVYLRRQDRYLESLWGYFIKVHSDFNLHFTDFVHEVQTSDAFRVDYYKRLQEISSYIGKENIIVRAYDHLEGNIFRDFIESIGAKWDDEFIIPKERINVKLDNRYIEVKRRINELQLLNKKIITKILFERQAKALQNSNSKNEKTLLSIEQRELLCEKYRSNNDKIEKEFLNGKKLFSYEITREQSVLNETEIQTEVEKILFKLCQEQEKEIVEAKKEHIFNRLKNFIYRNIRMFLILANIKDEENIKRFKHYKSYKDEEK